jgi:hypothetical protein
MLTAPTQVAKVGFILKPLQKALNIFNYLRKIKITTKDPGKDARFPSLVLVKKNQISNLSLRQTS